MATIHSTRMLLLGICIGFCALPIGADPATPPANALFVNGATGNDFTGNGTIGNPYKSIATAIDAQFNDIQTTATNAVTDNLRHFLDAAVLWADGTTTLALQSIKGKAALIVGNSGLYNRTADLMIKRELMRIGYNVQVVDDDLVWRLSTLSPWLKPTFGLPEANAMDVIVISGTTNYASVTNLRGTTTPVILMNPACWWSWGYCSLGSTTNPASGVETDSIQIVDQNSPLALGFSNGSLVKVYRHNHSVSMVNGLGLTLAPTLNTVASRPALPAEPCMWTMPQGGALGTGDNYGGTGNDSQGVPNGNPIAVNPARAVGFFLSGLTPTVGSQLNNTTEFITALSTPYGAALVGGVPVNAPTKTVCVAAGTYLLDQPLAAFKNLTLQGGWNAAFDDQAATRTTTLDGQYKSRILLLHNQNFTLYGNPNTNQNNSLNVSTQPAYTVNDNAVIDGFTFTRGRMYSQFLDGGAIYLDGNALNVNIRNCTFHDNATDRYGGVIMAATTLAGTGPNCTFSDCAFTSNSNYGAGFDVIAGGTILGTINGSAVAFNRCLFQGNNSSRNTGGIIGINNNNVRSISFANCLFVDNLTTGVTGSANSRPLIRFNGGTAASRPQSVINSTFYNNRSTGQVVYQNTGGTTFYQVSNNIFVGNSAIGTTTRTLVDKNGAPVASTLVTNNIEFNNPGYTSAGIMVVGSDGNLSVDPQLVNAAGGDFHLQAGSPAINGGLNIYTNPTDFDGTVRPQPAGGRWDIGAFEFPLDVPNKIDDWTWF